MISTRKIMLRNKGYTLLELISIIIILGIIILISIPTVKQIVDKAKEESCINNLMILEKSYQTYLELSQINHSDEVFIQYLDKNSDYECPEDGEIIYKEGKVICSEHQKNQIDPDDDNNEKPVPFL